MKLENLHSVYFIGIGGIGMSAIARYFNSLGIRVGGYDRVETPLSGQLVSEGIEIAYTEDIHRIPEWFLDTPSDRAMVVYTPAVPQSHAGLGFLRGQGYPVYKRSEVLAMITESKETIAVAGTHGKTTTSAMVAHILEASGEGCSAFLGGVATNYDSNLIFRPGSSCVVVEADEYDRSLLKLKPNMAVITSIEADHLDIYGNEEELKEGFRVFANLIPSEGVLFLRNGLSLSAGCKIITYGVEDPEADLYAHDLRIENGRYRFTVVHRNSTLGEVKMSYPGRHNIENAMAAIGVALYKNVPWEKITEALATFAGVKRRFEYHINRPGRVYIDDYAHHPTEIHTCVNSVKELYPDRRISGVFQPHLYSRTRDFAQGFAESLEELHDLLLMEIYPAREEPIEGVTSEWLLNKIHSVNKKLCSREELVEEVLKLKPEVLLTMGAGDIDKMIEPIKNALNEEDEENL